jgi:hypothetical protein
MSAAAGVSTIHAIAKRAPEMALCGAVLQLASQDAKSGDQEAEKSLGSDTCLWYCGRVAPDGVEPTLIQARLIEAAGLQVDET